MELLNVIQESVHDYARRRAAAIETACEAAVQGGEHGVLVIDHPDRVEVSVHVAVPYGMMYVADLRGLPTP